MNEGRKKFRASRYPSSALEQRHLLVLSLSLIFSFSVFHHFFVIADMVRQQPGREKKKKKEKKLHAPIITSIDGKWKKGSETSI